MAKFTEDKLTECVKWVETNGLYPQQCGAPVKDFCKAMGIDDATFRRWMKKADFADSIKNAREVFKSSTILEVTNAMKKKALGFSYKEETQKATRDKIINYDPMNGKKVSEIYGELKTVEATMRTVTVPPDTTAGIFLLTNLAPDQWKNYRMMSDAGGKTDSRPRELTEKEAKAFRQELEQKY